MHRITRFGALGVAGIALVAITLGMTLSTAAAVSAGRPSTGPGGPPAQFITNAGQLPAEVAFHAPTARGSVSITRRGEVVYAVPSGAGGAGPAVREVAVGSKPVLARGEGEPAQVSWLVGADRSRWREGLAGYPAVRLGELWPGIEGRLVARGATVEKIFEVQPGADPRRIALRLEPAPGSSARVAAQLNTRGEIEVRGDGGILTFSAPVAYQERGGTRVLVPVRYAVRPRSAAGPAVLTYGFRVGAYDRRAPLVIDPVLGSTLLGGVQRDRAHAVAVDKYSGNVFITGVAFSADYPTTARAYDLTLHPPVGAGPATSDVVVSKLSGDLSRLLASTYIGGASEEEGTAIAIDGNGKVYVTGWTGSSDFPVDAGDFYRGGVRDGFVVKLDNDLSRLEAGRYVGGSAEDVAQALVVHGDYVYLAGWTQSMDFVREHVATGQQVSYGTIRQDVAANDNAFVVMLSTDHLWARASTIVGGIDHDRALAIAVKPYSLVDEPFVVVGGATERWGIADEVQGSTFPTTHGAIYFHARSAPWVFVLGPGLLGLVSSTMLTDNQWPQPANPRFESAVRGLAVTDDGDIVAAGYVVGCNRLPVTVGAHATTCRNPGLSHRDGFVLRMSADLDEVVAGTYLGGNNHDLVMGLVRVSSAAGGFDLYVTGYTYSTNFPTTKGAHDATHNGDADAFVAKLSDDLTTLRASTYLGGAGNDFGMGIARNAQRDLYVAGYTFSGDFPTTAGAYQQQLDGASDAFVTRLSPALNATR